MKTISEDNKDSKITRKDALKRAGKYALFTATASIILLGPKASQALTILGESYGKRGGGDLGASPGGGTSSSTIFTKPGQKPKKSGSRDSPFK
jgi:hypothetical protein